MIYMGAKIKRLSETAPCIDRKGRGVLGTAHNGEGSQLMICRRENGDSEYHT